MRGFEPSRSTMPPAARTGARALAESVMLKLCLTRAGRQVSIALITGGHSCDKKDSAPRRDGYEGRRGLSTPSAAAPPWLAKVTKSLAGKNKTKTNVGALSDWIPGPLKVMRCFRRRSKIAALKVHPSPRFLKLHRFAG